MSASEKEKVKFTVTEKFKTRAFELLDESHAMQFAEGLRLNNAAAVVFGREEKRLMQKYKDDPRIKEMSLRVEASALAKADLFSRYKDAMTPQTKANEGWVVDGFVRGPEGRALEGLTVAAHDRQENRIKELGQATTNSEGYFTITVDKLPEDPPKQVFIRASKGRTLLPSNEVMLSPRPGMSERVEIVVSERERDPKQGGDKPTDKPEEKPVDDKAKPEPITAKPTTRKSVVSKKTATGKGAKRFSSKTKAKPGAKKSE
jgi:hypothetical protein